MTSGCARALSHATFSKRRKRFLVTGSAAEQAIHQAALRRRWLLGGGSFGSLLGRLVFRREHGTRHRSALALGADRGVHLIAL
jgi:hypothetical protein